MVEHIIIALNDPRSNVQAEHFVATFEGPKNPTVDPQMQYYPPYNSVQLIYKD